MSEHSRHHIMPISGYLAVWAALLVLTAVTVGVSYFNFGVLNIAVAIIVATVKAALVCFYFMHLKYDTLFNRIIFFSTIIFIALFMGFTFIDINSRMVVVPSQFSDNSPLPVPAEFRKKTSEAPATPTSTAPQPAASSTVTPATANPAVADKPKEPQKEEKK